MALKVIGTGFGRTGTMSLKLALEELGFGNCYHMYELIKHPEELSYWEKAKKGEPVNWDELFTGYQSAVDFPAILFYEDLIKKYPEAKIIHTTREAESWYKSFRDTILWAVDPPFFRILKMAISLPFSKHRRKFLNVLKFNGKVMDEMFGKETKYDKDHMIKIYNQYNEKVLNTIPKERSIVFDVKSGWEPLCKFLNVPVPSTPFPKVNSSEEFKTNVKNS